MSEKENVVVLGASTNPERYSHKAIVMLKTCGHTSIPVNPKFQEVEGLKCYRDLFEVNEILQQGPETLTVYIKAEISNKLHQEFLNLNPKRVIFNPGSENPELQKVCENAGIQVLNACTLVLLRTDQF